MARLQVETTTLRMKMERYTTYQKALKKNKSYRKHFENLSFLSDKRAKPEHF